MAIMLRQINAEIINLSYEFISPNKIMVRGDIEKQILYVSNNEVVQHQNEIVPFTVTFELVGLSPGTAIVVTATIEHISPRLIHNGTIVEQQIIIKITVTPVTSGLAVSQQFLIRSETILEEPSVKITDMPIIELENQDAQSIECNEEEPNITPLPDLTEIIEEKMRIMEEQLRYEIENSLRSQMRTEMELELQIRLADELRRKELEAQEAVRIKQEELTIYRNELMRKSTLQSLYGFKVKG